MDPVLLVLSEPLAWILTKASAPALLAMAARSALLILTLFVSRIINTLYPLERSSSRSFKDTLKFSSYSFRPVAIPAVP